MLCFGERDIVHCQTLDDLVFTFILPDAPNGDAQTVVEVAIGDADVCAVPL